MTESVVWPIRVGLRHFCILRAWDFHRFVFVFISQALGNHFSTGGQGQKSVLSCNMKRSNRAYYYCNIRKGPIDTNVKFSCLTQYTTQKLCLYTSVVCNFWHQLQILGGQLTPLTQPSRAPVLDCLVIRRFSFCVCTVFSKCLQATAELF